TRASGSLSPDRSHGAQNSARREGGRIADGAADALPPSGKPKDREAYRHHAAALDPAVRRRGHRMTAKMKRREFIALLGGAAAAWPLAARAQQGERMRRIGFLRAAPPPERELEAFMRGLADHGWVQGRNFVLVPQWGDGNIARLPELAIALVNAAVDIIVAEGVTTVRAARAVTATIPIVMTGAADPFVGGLVKSLARPGENVTGFTTLQADIAGKYLAIFRDTVPGLARVA